MILLPRAGLFLGLGGRSWERRQAMRKRPKDGMSSVPVLGLRGGPRARSRTDSEKIAAPAAVDVIIRQGRAGARLADLCR